MSDEHHFFSVCMEIWKKDTGHPLVLVLKRSGSVSMKTTTHKESGTKLQRCCCWISLSADVQFPCHDSTSKNLFKKQGRGKLSIHIAAHQETIETFFTELFLQTSSVIAEQSRRCVKSTSSLVLSVIKSEVLLDGDDPANKDFLLQQVGAQIEKLSQQDKLSKFCMDEGFLKFVEIRQFFTTRDTAEFSQFHAVACRESTLPGEGASQPKGWIQGNTKIGP